MCCWLLWWDVFHVMSKTFLVTSIGDSCYGVFIESNSFKCSDKRSTRGRPFTLAPSNVHCIAWSSQVDASLNDRCSFFCTWLHVQFRSYNKLLFICLPVSTLLCLWNDTSFLWVVLRVLCDFCFVVLITPRYRTKKDFFLSIFTSAL